MSIPKINFKRGDTVLCLSGADAGKSGKVLQVLPQRGKALVEGLNLIKKHMRKSEDNPNGGIVEREAPIDVSNLKKEGSSDK